MREGLASLIEDGLAAGHLPPAADDGVAVEAADLDRAANRQSSTLLMAWLMACAEPFLKTGRSSCGERHRLPWPAFDFDQTTMLMRSNPRSRPQARTSSTLRQSMNAPRLGRGTGDGVKWVMAG